MRPYWFLVALLVFQLLCSLLFILNILSTITQCCQLSWLVHEVIELGAALGLFAGVGVAAIFLRQTQRHNQRMQDRLRLSAGAFMELLEDRFRDWGLTPAERDVALFAIKGMNTSEIAELRGVSPGTIKAQTNAIYRKAGVSGRPQLLSQFIDDMMHIPDQTA